MKEIGFWDYTCPFNGSLEHYTQADWDVLLDDMTAGGFNSLALSIKWLTTGYASRYAWLDQDPQCTAIASKNALIYHALRGARVNGLHTWLLVVATIFSTRQFDLPGGAPYELPPGYAYGSQDFRVYDLDAPGLMERIELLFQEVVDLFGNDVDGIVVEFEFSDGEAAHRIPKYNEWSRQNNRPDFSTIKNIRLEPRGYPYTHWRDFTTSRRIEAMQRIEQVVRGRGFKGRLASIIEIDNQPMAVMGNVNLDMLRNALPEWPVVTYDSIYDRRRNRLATMDFCIQQPRQAGLEVYYLTRGVMTFGIPPGMPPATLEEQWRMSLEDAASFQPDILWFMGADCRVDGLVSNPIKLPEWGFADGRTARLKLMEMARNEFGSSSLNRGRSPQPGPPLKGREKEGKIRHFRGHSPPKMPDFASLLPLPGLGRGYACGACQGIGRKLKPRFYGKLPGI